MRTPSLSVFGESVGRCRETVASRTRGLMILLRDLAALIQRDATVLREVINNNCIEEKVVHVQTFMVNIDLLQLCLHIPYTLIFQKLRVRYLVPCGTSPSAATRRDTDSTSGRKSSQEMLRHTVLIAIHLLVTGICRNRIWM